MTRNWKLKQSAPGQILVITIVLLAVILVLSASLFSKVTSFIRFGSNSVMHEQAVNLAEAAIDKALWQLNQTGGTYTGETDTALGTSGTFTITVTDKSPGIKTITATGSIPNGSSPAEKQTVQVDTSISSDIISFHYAIQVGEGGIVLGQSAQINGTVYSNAPDGANKSIQGGQSSTITGDAWTVGTISTPNPLVQGTKHQNQPPSQMPTIDYQKWRDIAAAGGTIDCSVTPALCTLSGQGIATIGNKKYIGDLDIKQQKIVTMTGPVYVTGNISLSQSAQLNLDESFGSNGTVLITDGTISVGQSAGINPTNANPKGYILVVTPSADNSAVTINQSGANAIFYALEGGAQMGQGAHATAVVAKSLTLGQTVTLTYDQGLASANFSSGPGGSWAIRKGTYHFK